MKSLKLQQSQETGSIFINELKNILVTVMAATAVIEGEITLGTMLAIQYIVGQLNSPLEQLMSFIYSLQDVKISLERINEIHGNKNEECMSSNKSSFGDSEDLSINLNSLDFKYNPHNDDYTLHNVSFDIPQGKVTAIVGASGSGKTTLIKLMLGYYPSLSGDIYIAGENLNNYNLKWWRRQCGVVMQDGVIFSESIARNIAVDDGEIDKERLVKAAEIANIHEIIIALLIAAYFIPYPDNLQVNAIVVDAKGGTQQIQAYVPYSYVSTIHEGMNANIEFEGYPSADYGCVSAIITCIEKEVYDINDQNYFIVYMDMSKSNDIAVHSGMKGTANILISDISVLQKFLGNK